MMISTLWKWLNELSPLNFKETVLETEQFPMNNITVQEVKQLIANNKGFKIIVNTKETYAELYSLRESNFYNFLRSVYSYPYIYFDNVENELSCVRSMNDYNNLIFEEYVLIDEIYNQ